MADLFAKFPNIGHRTASRFVFYLLKLPKEKIDELTSAIQELKNKVKFCLFCFQPSEVLTQEDLCHICSNPMRKRQLLCIVEKETDLISIENAKKYNGLYFILGGVLNSRKNNAENLRIGQLKERVKTPQKFGLVLGPGLDKANFKEIIIATNPTPEGMATSVLIERALKELSLNNLKITRLANGLPFGGELEYADQETLESAFEGRK